MYIAHVGDSTVVMGTQEEDTDAYRAYPLTEVCAQMVLKGINMPNYNAVDQYNILNIPVLYIYRTK